jgi:hypothetical protein
VRCECPWPDRSNCVRIDKCFITGDSLKPANIDDEFASMPLESTRLEDIERAIREGTVIPPIVQVPVDTFYSAPAKLYEREELIEAQNLGRAIQRYLDKWDHPELYPSNCCDEPKVALVQDGHWYVWCCPNHLFRHYAFVVFNPDRPFRELMS